MVARCCRLRGVRELCVLAVVVGSVYGEGMGDKAGGAREDSVRVYRLPSVEVTEELGGMVRAGGRITVVAPQRFEAVRAMSVEEVLRTVAGVVVRPEDGLGLRVNIGMRGLPPTRSKKVLVLEDGVPIAPAPYGYPELYYHPPVERLWGVEVVTGGAQILYGPHTVGGVVNYVTPVPGAGPRWHVRALGGEGHLWSLFGRYGTLVPESGGGILLQGLYKQGQLNRKNTGVRLGDGLVKAWTRLGEGQQVLVKVDAYNEVSQVTYAGLTQAQFEEDPFQNPFVHDTFAVERYAGQLRWEWQTAVGQFWLVGYGAYLQRDWWRQGSLIRQRLPDGSDTLVSADNSADPGNYPGVRVLPDPHRADGRLRRYWFAGVEGRWHHEFTLGTVSHRVSAGVRLHGERQHRYQIRAQTAVGRTGEIVEDNWRWGTALGAFVQEQFLWRQWALTVGIRGEGIRYRRLNVLGNAGEGVGGWTQLGAVIPAVGVTFAPVEQWVFFTGLYAGFAPPRVEDVIDNSGRVIELEPERSWNWEFGVRARLLSALALEVTAFRLQFRNQIIPATLAGGVLATLTNAGRTLHQGLEFSAELDGNRILPGSALRVLSSALWLPVARYEGERYSILEPQRRITGNRLPYAPEYTLSVGVEWKPWQQVRVQLVATSVGAQWGDDLNTVEPTPNGRQGRVAPYTVFDGTLEWELPSWHVGLIVVGKNLLNRVYIVDRSRGILPGMPRRISVGLEWKW